MLLRCQAIGRLTDNPSFRTVNVGGDDVPVAEFSIAVNQGYGENQTTEYINCVAWRRLAEIVRDNLFRGRKIYVEGKQKTRRYTITKDGVEFTQSRTEWILETLEFCDNAGHQKQDRQDLNTGVDTEEDPF
jgi:single-strand DNA-binding protein